MRPKSKQEHLRNSQNISKTSSAWAALSGTAGVTDVVLTMAVCLGKLICTSYEDPVTNHTGQTK